MKRLPARHFAVIAVAGALIVGPGVDDLAFGAVTFPSVSKGLEQ